MLYWIRIEKGDKVNQSVNVKINSKIYAIKKGSTLKEISEMVQSEYQYPILVAKVNNSLKELNYKVNSNKEIEFYDLTKPFGNRAHINGLVFILLVAIKELYGADQDIIVDHSLDRGLYIESSFPINEEIIEQIKRYFPLHK